MAMEAFSYIQNKQWIRIISTNTLHSFVPRPHPLMRRNGLVNQVEFLGLVHTFATVSPSNVQTFYTKPARKRYDYLSRDKKFYVVMEVLRNNYQSCSLIGPYHFKGISPRNLTPFTRLFLTRRRTRAGHKTRFT